ncbi:MAG: hypothetical protein HYV76_00980 [Candidatus Vogelbacteria bacterium]|nr:hypothetical protein [Candidatus Vogelbacteria bacterium]
MPINIAVITPQYKNDYLCDTILDGLLNLVTEDKSLNFKITSGYTTDLEVTKHILNIEQFEIYAATADLIFLCWGKNNTNKALAAKINRFEQTIFIDGSELGGNRRYNELVEIDTDYLTKAVAYFKREKPYLDEVRPLPFGIESHYIKYQPDQIKDIDFICVFGQKDFPSLRREVEWALIDFCQANNFSYWTKPTNTPDEFHRLLARAKVGVSVGGGGFDTARFWEILGNNCLLMTEKIDIYESDSKRLDYKRIWQFKDLAEFKAKLKQMGQYLRSSYQKSDLELEYNQIIKDHSSKARVLEILNLARVKKLIP